MAFDGNSPATDGDILANINQIRENLNELRKHEQGTSYPTNPVPGMNFWKTDTKEWYKRNNANDTWILIWSEANGFNADAINIAYDNNNSGLSATDVKNALDEIESRLLDDTGGNIDGLLTFSNKGNVNVKKATGSSGANPRVDLGEFSAGTTAILQVKLSGADAEFSGMFFISCDWAGQWKINEVITNKNDFNTKIKVYGYNDYVAAGGYKGSNFLYVEGINNTSDKDNTLHVSVITIDDYKPGDLGDFSNASLLTPVFENGYNGVFYNGSEIATLANSLTNSDFEMESGTVDPTGNSNSGAVTFNNTYKKVIAVVYFQDLQDTQEKIVTLRNLNTDASGNYIGFDWEEVSVNYDFGLQWYCFGILA